MKNEKKRYEQLCADLQELPWLLNGSVFKRDPSSSTGKSHPTYIWTRKVKGKTVTVSLSQEQYGVFRQAILENRKVEKTLKQMRLISEKTLLSEFTGVTRKNVKGK